MTKLLEEAIEKTRLLPTRQQDEAARVLLTLVEQSASYFSRLTDEQIAEVKRRQTNPHYATDEEVAAFFRHAGL